MTDPCKKCGKPTELLSQYCEECLITQKHRIFNAQYKEHPICRKAIEKILSEHPELTLFKLVFPDEYYDPPCILLTGYMLKQARTMLKESRGIF